MSINRDEFVRLYDACPEAVRELVSGIISGDDKPFLMVRLHANTVEGMESMQGDQVHGSIVAVCAPDMVSFLASFALDGLFSDDGFRSGVIDAVSDFVFRLCREDVDTLIAILQNTECYEESTH